MANTFEGLESFRGQRRPELEAEYPRAASVDHCNMSVPGYVCTRVKGHEGRVHVAHISDGTAVARWLADWPQRKHVEPVIAA